MFTNIYLLKIQRGKFMLRNAAINTIEERRAMLHGCISTNEDFATTPHRPQCLQATLYRIF
jgi:hypothetical protein